MAVSFDTYYINAEDFSDATSIFTDAAMTNIAPDGTYQYNGVHRTMSNEILGSPFFCGTCCANCSGTYIYPIPPAKDRYHTICSNIGNGTGSAIVVKFKFTSSTPQYLGYPIGLAANFDGQYYDGVSSNRFGYLPELMVGNTNAILPSDLYGTYDLDGYAWQPLTSAFVQTQNVQMIVIPSIFNLTGNNPDECYMLIPKTSVTSTVDINVYSPHRRVDQGGGGCDITIPCPVALPSMRLSQNTASVALACPESVTERGYIMRVNSLSGNPSVYDRIFTTPSGSINMSGGYYSVINSYQGDIQRPAWIHIGSNGQVESAGVCASGEYQQLTEMISSEMRPSFIQACNYQNISGTNIPDQQYWHNGSGDAPVANDIAYSDVLGQNPLPDGFYQLLREYKIIEVDSTVNMIDGEIISVSNC